MFSTLCTLWSDREIESSRKDRTEQAYLELSMMGALPAADADEFQTFFASGTLNGLYDRFLFVPGPPKWDWKEEGSWEPPTLTSLGGRDVNGMQHDLLVMHEARAVTVPSEAYRELSLWRKKAGEKSRNRLGDMALRIAIIASAINHDGKVTTASLKAALALMERQEAVREVYTPSKALNAQARAEESIVNYMERALAEYREGIVYKNPRTGNDLVIEGGWVHMPTLAKRFHLSRHCSGSLDSLLRSMEKQERLKQYYDKHLKRTVNYFRFPDWHWDPTKDSFEAFQEQEGAA